MREFDEKAATWDDYPDRIKRAEVIASRLASAVNLTVIKTAMEYGSGTGLMSFALKDDIREITLMDDSAEMTKVARQKIIDQKVTNLIAVHGDLLKGPLRNERFDFIFIVLTLHHIGDVEELLRKFHNLLSPKGQLAIIDLEKEDGSFHDDPFHGHKGFERSDLENRLNYAGFVPAYYEVCYHIEKETEKGIREYPVFLMVAEKK